MGSSDGKGEQPTTFALDHEVIELEENMKKVMILLSLLSVASAFGLDHTQWDQWLKKFTHVSGSVTRVDYKSAKADPELLDGYLKAIDAVTKAQYEAMTPMERLAFLINAYNAFTVKWILSHYPVTSIKDTVGFFGSPWKEKFFKLFGEDQSLDGIEHGTIRAQFKEPRIHFAVVCASKGCPALKNEAYVAPRLNDQLESSAKAFLADATRNHYEDKEGKLYLSKIFDWYGGDFKAAVGSVQAFVLPRMATADAVPEAKYKDVAVSFLKYDWSLNDLER